MKIGSPCPEVTLYVSGMLLTTLGLCAVMVSFDPRPFDSSSWIYFLFMGIIFLSSGGVCLVFTATISECPSNSYCMGDTNGRTYASAVDLLDDVQSVGSSDSPVVKLREARIQITQESVRTVKNCMMMQSPMAGSSGILFYKETVV